MAIDIRGIEASLIKTVREYIGDKLSLIQNGIVLWQTLGRVVFPVTNTNHVFVAADKASAIVARDTYFTNNPTELVQGIVVSIGYPLVDTVYYNQKYDTKASVVRSRAFSNDTSKTAPTSPDYPYASVDYTRITDEGYELTERFFDEDGNYVYQTHKLASFTVRFFGTSQDDVLSICNEMHLLFEVEEVRSLVTALSPVETRVRSKTDPVFVATNMEDKYREIASFDIILAVLDETVVPADKLNPLTNKYNSIVGGDTEATPIDNVILDTSVGVNGFRGGLDKDGDGIPDPALDIYVETDVIP